MLKEGFLKEHSRTFASLMWALDLAMPVLAAWLAFKIHPDFEFIPQRYINAVALGLAGSALVFPVLSYGKGFRGVPVIKEIKRLTIVLAVLFIALALVALFTKSTASYSRIWFAEWFVLSWLGMVGYRVVLRFVLRWVRSYGFNQRSVVIVGGGDVALTVIGRLLSATWSGFQVSGIFTDDERIKGQFLQDGVIYGGYEDVAEFVEQADVDQVWLAMPIKRQEQLHRVIRSLDHCTADIRYVPDVFEFELFNHSMSEVAGLPVLNLTASPMEGGNRVFKAIEDRLLAFLILLIASPVMLAIAVGIKLGSR
ncbi:MAG: undecaprenyl-phosphate glucose phosphotransferase, partial [Gammaproteobacteria bacterium]|nr:undecaprenyl-phosphate glucose phosphotransferase [Gammaproteobacteria bacterium]